MPAQHHQQRQKVCRRNSRQCELDFAIAVVNEAAELHGSNSSVEAVHASLHPGTPWKRLWCLDANRLLFVVDARLCYTIIVSAKHQEFGVAKCLFEAAVTLFCSRVTRYHTGIVRMSV